MGVAQWRIQDLTFGVGGGVDFVKEGLKVEVKVKIMLSFLFLNFRLYSPLPLQWRIQDLTLAGAWTLSRGERGGVRNH